MNYIRKVHRFVRLVQDEMVESTNLIDDGQGPTVQHCLIAFKNLSKRYDERTARKIFAIATGKKKKYLALDEGSKGKPTYEQRIVITDEGLILLTWSGYFKALADSVDASLVISIIALVISVAVAIFKH